MAQDDKKLLRIGWYASGNIYDMDQPDPLKRMLFWDVVLAYMNAGFKVIDGETGKLFPRQSVEDHIRGRY